MSRTIFLSSCSDCTRSGDPGLYKIHYYYIFSLLLIKIPCGRCVIISVGVLYSADVLYCLVCIITPPTEKFTLKK